MKKKGKLQIDAIWRAYSDQRMILSLKHMEVKSIWLPRGRDIGLSGDPTLPIYNARVVTIDDNVPTMVPAIGEALITLFCAKNRVDAVLGDLAERFADEVVVKGKKRAKLLFWVRVVRSLGPLLWTKVRKAGFLAILFEIGRRWIGS
jgi:hypothetical protein